MQADSQMIELQDSIKKYGLPYPYTKKGALDYINFILSSNPNDTFAYAIDVDGVAVGSIGAFRQGNIHCCTAEIGYYLAEEY